MSFVSNCDESTFCFCLDSFTSYNLLHQLEQYDWVSHILQRKLIWCCCVCIFTALIWVHSTFDTTCTCTCYCDTTTTTLSLTTCLNINLDFISNHLPSPNVFYGWGDVRTREDTSGHASWHVPRAPRPTLGPHQWPVNQFQTIYYSVRTRNRSARGQEH